MTEDKVYRHIEKLRDPQRLALLETEKVVDRCLEGIEPETVLDVGTGSGIFAEAFVRRGLQVTGVDLQETMLQAARAFVPQATFQQGSSERLPFADRSFDLVFMGLLLHETEDPAASVHEAARVGKKRLAVLEWPYREGAFGPPRHHRLPPEKVEELIQRAGFSRIEAVPFTHLVLYVADL